MDIKAISGFYSVEYGRIIEKGEMVAFDDKRAEELIKLGLAIAGPAPAKPAANKKQK